MTRGYEMHNNKLKLAESDGKPEKPIVLPLNEWQFTDIEVPDPIGTRIVEGLPPTPVIWFDNRSYGVDENPLVSVGEPGVLTGPGGSGKSLFALGLACACATGKDSALGFNIRPGKVILISYEDSPTRLAERVFHINNGKIPENLFVMNNPNPLWTGVRGNPGHISSSKTWDELEEACKRLEPSLVIVDSAGEALGNIDENHSLPVNTLYRELSRLPKLPGVLIIAQPTKEARNLAESGDKPGTGAVVASIAWQDRARVVAYMRKVGYGKSDLRRIEIIKSNYGPDGPVECSVDLELKIFRGIHNRKVCRLQTT